MTQRISIFLAALLAAFLAACQPLPPPRPSLAEPPYAPDSGSLLVRCGALIDGKSDEVRRDVSVLIKDGRFSGFNPTVEETSALPLLDLSGHTCLPGFIEMHAHMLEDFEELTDLTAYYDYSHEDFMAKGREFSRLAIDAGFTTARNLGVYYGWADRDLRDLIDHGDLIGPRMQAAGFYLTVPGGGGDLLEVGGSAEHIPAHLRLGVSRSPEEFRRHAHEAVAGGADVIKVIASGAVLAYGGVPGEPEMTPEELAAVVEVAHAAGLRVAAHAHGAQSIREAILAGADTVEHATYLDEEGIRLAIEHDVALVMDIGAGDWMIEAGREQGWVEEFQRKVLETTQTQRESFRRAYEAGATLVYGTDVAIYPHGMQAMQFPYMVKWGMTPMEAIKSATSVAARYMGWEDRVGAVEPGLYGDLVAVTGDPLADISILEQVDIVVKGGLVFKAPPEAVR
jgi:imidazolonepropionase-like amidohydrolase